MTVTEIIAREESFRYQMLGRMQMDCEYYLGNGGRHPKHLWATSVEEHIDYMKKIWKAFDEDKKPEWLSYEEILEFERKMLEE